ncbi:hypothetical protein APHAL10511_001689 [Amanita phalloides]|nr:hypothetical protein APHAL10511_001689 [Amanita phalloides]
MVPSPRKHEPERPRCIDPASSASVSRRLGVINVTRRSTLFHDGILGGNCATDIGYSEMCGGEDFSLLVEHTTHDITTSQCVRFDTCEPESRHGRAQLHESDQAALRVAYAHRENIVLDSATPNLAPHIVITPPEKNDYDCYTQWLNATGPQWPGHLVVTMPPNAIDYTLVHTPPQSSQLRGTGPAHIAKAVFCSSKFRTFVASMMHERAHMENIVDVLQRIHRKAVAITASEIGRGFLTCEEYACPSEKPFRWTDPAEPFLQRKNQYRGTIVIESPSPFTIPHIIINEPPPQDPWIYWHNATTTPQDHGLGQYLTVPHRLAWYIRAPDGAENYWVTPRVPEEQFDVNWQEDVDSSGSSSSESEPETPDPDPMMGDFLIHGRDDDLISMEVRGDLDFDIDFFGSCDVSPWSGIINRYSTKTPTFVTCDHQGATSPAMPTIMPYEEEEEDELPPFDDWYQTVAARAAVIMTA